MRYKVGDEVVLRILDDFGYKHTVPRPAKVQVIGHDSAKEENWTEYLCYVPPYVNVPSSTLITDKLARKFKIERKFAGEIGVIITAGTPIIKHLPCDEGEKCDRCDHFVSGGTREPGEDFYCRACKENPWR